MQTGAYLLIRSLTPTADHSGLLYQVTGVFLQCLWVPAMWCLLRTMRVPTLATVCALAVTFFSGFAIVNDFFVWPKMVSGAFILLLGACVTPSAWRVERRRAINGVACGLAASWASLTHEGAALLLGPLVVIVAVAPSRWPSGRVLLSGLAVFVALMAPWLAYQHYYDPPGDSLAMLQLAGHIDSTSSGNLVGAIEDYYRPLTLKQIVVAKEGNLKTPFHGETGMRRDAAKLVANLFATGGRARTVRDATVEDIRGNSFFYLYPELGLVGLAPLARILILLRRRRRSPDLAAADWIWVWLVIGFITWGVVLVGARATVIHQGSYGIELLAYVAGTVALWRLWPPFAVAVTALQASFGAVVYLVIANPWPGGASPSGPVNPVDLVVAVVGTAAVFGLPWVAGSPEPKPRRVAVEAALESA